MLIKAKDIFKRDGYRVVVWDAYRPISAQKRFWELIPNDDFIARPPDMEKIKSFRPTHLNGMCVDITLADNSGKEVVMPSAFDDFTDKAKLGSADADSQAFINANYMKEVMESVGFQAYENEWWHFYDITTPPVPFMDFQI